MDGEGADPRIAVIGTAFRLPGAETPEELWRLVLGGEDRFTRFTPADLRAAGVPREEYGHEDFSGASALLDDIAGFDARHFGMTAREAALTDPQHRLFLECAQHALEDAGYPGERDGTRIGVFASTGYHLYSMRSYLMNNVLPNEESTDWPSGTQVMVGNFTDFNATRVAYRLDLTGPAVNVQTGCSSSLVGVQLAAQALLMGDCDIALAGASAVHAPQVLGYRHAKGSILSRSGRLRAFDAAADGTVGGTGVVAVALKRLDRALADGDTVHGVIRGWGVGNDGADKRTYAAPSARGQRAAIRRALDHAGVTADTIGYLETHGTGTYKGDPIELAGVRAAYREDTDRAGYCALGAVKANIGHLDVASGLAGLVKALLVLRHGVIPPVAGFTAPNPLLELDGSPFYVPDAPRPWPPSAAPRRAGLTSLGIGGTNVHLVLEQAPAPEPRPARPAAPPDVLLVSASSPQALADNARALRDALRARPELHPADLATTTALGRSHGRHRIAVRGGGPAALADALDALLSGPAPLATAPVAEPARTAFQFTGQGSLRAGAAAELYERFPSVREVLDACEEAHLGSTGVSLLTGLLDPDTHPGVWPTATGQPALYALQCALVRLWEEAGITPAAVTGHSVGEYAALHAAGALPLLDGLELLLRRGALMRDHCPPGAMVAVFLDREAALALAASEPGIEAAVSNGERSQVLAGPVDAVERLITRLGALDVPHERLAVDRAFHTALTEPVLDAFGTVLDKVPFTPVRVPFTGALDGATRAPGWVPDRGYLLRQAREPVRFDLALRGVADGRPDALLEIGPHTTLSGLARRALPGVPAVPSLRRGAGLGALFGAATALHLAGADVRWEVFLAGTGGRRVPLPGYRFQHRHHWIGPPPRGATAGSSPETGASGACTGASGTGAEAADPEAGAQAAGPETTYPSVASRGDAAPEAWATSVTDRADADPEARTTSLTDRALAAPEVTSASVTPQFRTGPGATSAPGTAPRPVVAPLGQQALASPSVTDAPPGIPAPREPTPENPFPTPPAPAGPSSGPFPAPGPAVPPPYPAPPAPPAPTLNPSPPAAVPAPPAPAREEPTMTTAGTRTAPETEGPLLDSILRVLARGIGEDPASIPADTPFFDLGADSLLMINVLREIEEEHRVRVTMRELFEETGTARLLARLIASRLPEGPGPAPAPVAEPVPEAPAPAPVATARTAPRPPGPPAAPAPGPAHPFPAEPAHPVGPPVPAAPAAPALPATDASEPCATRAELRELALRVQQLSQIQLQLMTQLTQLLALQGAATADRPHDGAAR
ncbi:beta-ketoacyl synthase N-terminal-like domain-containing protein [Streptomyces sp. NPDC052077]|uniref:type I polyketide synthase n=1 Tax=Streptomyces sp. NPDC052077 TaxID=3154757 RepID=UPI00342F57B4